MNARDASGRPARHAVLGAATLLAMTLGAVCCGGTAAEPGLSDDIASLGAAAATLPADSAAPNAAAVLDPEEAELAWVACMREHGADIPDPQIDSEGFSWGGGDVEAALEMPENFEVAAQECDHLLQSAHGDFKVDPEAEAATRDMFLSYAECMREHGIDMPDPEFDERGGVTITYGDGVEPGDDDLDEADRACIETMFGDAEDDE